jgi:hypothetical protein
LAFALWLNYGPLVSQRLGRWPVDDWTWLPSPRVDQKTTPHRDAPIAFLPALVPPSRALGGHRPDRPHLPATAALTSLTAPPTASARSRTGRTCSGAEPGRHHRSPPDHRRCRSLPELPIERDFAGEEAKISSGGSGGASADSVASSSRSSCPPLRASPARALRSSIVASAAPAMQPLAVSRVSTVVDVFLSVGTSMAVHQVTVRARSDYQDLTL